MSIFLPKSLDLERVDLAVASDDVRCVPQEEGRWFKPLHFSTSTGTWTNLGKLAPGAEIGRHVHAGGAVHAYVLAGSWRYLERHWVAEPGSFVWEPPGDVHTLQVLGHDPMITLFTVSGVIQYLDDSDDVVRQDDLRSRRQLYIDYCRNHGLEPLALTT